MKKSTKVVLSSVLGLSLGLGGATGVMYYTNSNSDVKADSNNMTLASEGMIEVDTSSTSTSDEITQETADQIDFADKVTLPDEVPVEVEQRLEEVSTIADNSEKTEDSKLLTVYYLDEEKKSFVSVSSTDANVEPKDPGIIEFEENGVNLKYFDNNTYQFLYFNKDGLYYELKGQKDKDDPSKKFSKEELVDVYKSMK